MPIPGFTAETALYRTRGSYRLGVDRTDSSRRVLPQVAFISSERNKVRDDVKVLFAEKRCGREYWTDRIGPYFYNVSFCVHECCDVKTFRDPETGEEFEIIDVETCRFKSCGREEFSLG